MLPQITDSRRANFVAQAMQRAFETYHTQFKAITERAKERFERREWHEIQDDSVERLALYKNVVTEVVTEIHDLLGERSEDKQMWIGIKAVYSGWIAERDDWELAETFFNSVTRRIFTTVGVDSQIEFVDTDFKTPPIDGKFLKYCVYRPMDSLSALVDTILTDYSFAVDYEDKERDVALVTKRVMEHLQKLDISTKISHIDMVKSIFYRGRATYLIGRLCIGSQLLPFVIALANKEKGIIVDAVLMDEDMVSILFSFAHSYFRVLVDRPYDLIQFLKTIIPQKKVAELYISLGYNKHGKTELYRDLLHHLADSHDKFEIARGERGMVMVVFTMPSYDVVFKIIRDRFARPKDVTRREVMEKYHLVFQHDRAGRLIDAQEFEHLQFSRRNISDELLEELREETAQTVMIKDDYVIIKHAYIERRLTPLNLYLSDVDDEAAKAAVIDYGNAIKDLMVTNIFPGDLLLKNFGVTRHGRVIFYDYDELCLLTDCKFRKMPKSRSYEDEMFVDTWFSVGENDVFPEQFPSFLGLRPELQHVFEEHHSDLFEVSYWRQIQKQIKEGNLIRIFPYPQHYRLRQNGSQTTVPQSLVEVVP